MELIDFRLVYISKMINKNYIQPPSFMAIEKAGYIMVTRLISLMCVIEYSALKKEENFLEEIK